MTELHQTRNSATESIPASPKPVRATVGSNTETDDDCRPATFHREAFGAKAPFSIKLRDRVQGEERLTVSAGLSRHECQRHNFIGDRRRPPSVPVRLFVQYAGCRADQA